jgi:hypothetical protein
MNTKAPEIMTELQKRFTGPMTESERAFLRDVQATIEFSLRNGLSFPVVVGAIHHDCAEIARDLFDLNQAKARGFRPKVEGYSQLSPDDFGGEEEPLD